MGWSLGFDQNWNRDVGYGVPAFCDHPECASVIDRGLSYVCGNEPMGGDHGCGLYFCSAHLAWCGQFCARCAEGSAPFEPRPEHPRWIRHKLKHPSWALWRAENAATVALYRKILESSPPPKGSP